MRYRAVKDALDNSNAAATHKIALDPVAPANFSNGLVLNEEPAVAYELEHQVRIQEYSDTQNENIDIQNQCMTEKFGDGLQSGPNEDLADQPPAQLERPDWQRHTY